jgi:hypothetical protein
VRAALVATVLLVGAVAGGGFAHANPATPAPGPANVDRPGTAVPPPGMPTLAELEARGATIGAIEIHVQNVFDTTDPRENRWFHRGANRLHYPTRENTVREQLLFATGQPLSQRHAQETERLLRGRDYLNDAWIVPARYDAEANVVDLSVTVRDVWTLNPGVSFSRAGGENSSGFEIEEKNLLGRGIETSLGRSRDVDRTSTIFEWYDPNVLGSWWQLDLDYLDSSDGEVVAAAVQRPFYALDTRVAYGVSGYDGTSLVSRYDRGVIVDQFAQDARRVQVYAGRSAGLRDGWARRWYAGWRHQETRFVRRPELALQPSALPDDRKLSYPWVGWQLVEDRYVEETNVDLIGRTEDVYLGRTVYAELGWSDRAFGADRDALLASAAAAAGWALATHTQVFADANVSGRIESGAARNVVASASGRWFRRLSDHQSLYARLTGTTTHELDAERQLLLGGEEGLRGYPLRFQGGTSSALVTLEHRVYTDWYPFRLVRFGTAVFFDAGRTWGRSYTGSEPFGLLKDVGFGLRFGNVRTGLGNVLHVDFSYALDAKPGVERFEITVQTRARF